MKIVKLIHGIVISFIFLAGGCGKKTDQLFTILPANQTGITFNNSIIEDEYLNILTNEYIYNGMGLGIADFNGDGLQDIYFSGGMVGNKLYLNSGDLTFRDVTGEAGVSADDIWSTGISIPDINGDGLPDIYVCASNRADSQSRKNKLFINRGPDNRGIPVFEEQAHRYGIDDDGYSTQGAFFDYDKDGDPDLYVLTNVLETPTPNSYRERKLNGTAPNNDRFYRNEGNGHFENFTRDAGIVNEGYGLGISIVDINNDGWSDIYITNDYLTNDLLYINNRDGTFTNRIADYIKHQTHSAMGHDIADVNNDGLPDIFTLDMLPESNQRLKQMHASSRYENNGLNEQFGYQYQYKRNMLQINEGTGPAGNHVFSEVGLYAGIYSTDWSWTALLADYDNDGYRDLFVSNGYPKDVTDLDYATTEGMRSMAFSSEEILKVIPARHLSNYIFKNNGDLSFTDMTREWGIKKPSFSNGGGYADFDNDGDLDIVVSNINEPAILYRNNLYAPGNMSGNHFIRVRLSGTGTINDPTGTKLYLYYGTGQIQYAEYSVNHGFVSNVEPVVHFGLGSIGRVDSLVVMWPDGTRQTLEHPGADQVLKVNYATAEVHAPVQDTPVIMRHSGPLFAAAAAKHGILFKHTEVPFNDFQIQPDLPHQLSQYGPGISVGDIDNNGLADLFIGGSRNGAPVIFYQHENGFSESAFPAGPIPMEMMGSVLFDADGDGDTDLYVVGGGYELSAGDDGYLDRLYINQGNGNWQWDPDALPAIKNSGSCVRAADFDNDGDLDLFIGGRVVPGHYPEAAASYILKNETSGKNVLFSDATSELCPSLQHIGLVTDALWTDVDNDGSSDLVIAGEWMPVMVFINQKGSFKNITGTSGTGELKGWWNSLAAGDFDNDGDMDILAGNLGLNSIYKASKSEPVTAYHADFDNDGRYDVVITTWMPDISGNRRPFPIHFRSDIFSQLDKLKSRFRTYKSYSEATIDSIFSPGELEIAQKLEANCFQSMYFENQGSGHFESRPLPLEAQMAPVYGMIPVDLNGDRFLDVILVGNDFGYNVFWGRMDAMNGLTLIGNGSGGFVTQGYRQSGLFVSGDAKSLALVSGPEDRLILLAGQNQDSLRVFDLPDGIRIYRAGNSEVRARLIWPGGAARLVEFHYGDTYLSQSERIMTIPSDVSTIEVYERNGAKKSIDMEAQGIP